MAMAGFVLGIIDIVLFAVLITVASHHSFSWHMG